MAINPSWQPHVEMKLDRVFMSCACHRYGHVLVREGEERTMIRELSCPA